MARMRRWCAACAIALAAAVIMDVSAAQAAFGDRALHMGQRGRDVRELQSLLTRLGRPTAVDGVFGRGTRRSVRGYERAEELRVDGRVSRVQARGMKRRAGPVAPAQEVPHAALSADGRTAIAPPGAPEQVRDAIAAANKITRKPYRYGGGHRRFRDSGYDCSGTVSFALHGAGLLASPLDSTGFMSWGRRGRGDWITVYANSGHAYAVIAGLRFDTSGRGERGPRWRTESRAARRFVARRPSGL
jgi:cell wall-associated NlpC family hydrolase